MTCILLALSLSCNSSLWPSCSLAMIKELHVVRYLMGSPPSNYLQGTKSCQHCVTELGNESLPIKPSDDCIQTAAITPAYVWAHVWIHTITHRLLLSTFIVSILVV